MSHLGLNILSAIQHISRLFEMSAIGRFQCIFRYSRKLKLKTAAPNAERYALLYVKKKIEVVSLIIYLILLSIFLEAKEILQLYVTCYYVLYQLFYKKLCMLCEQYIMKIPFKCNILFLIFLCTYIKNLYTNSIYILTKF